jgi:hypothetical protein
MPDLHNRGGDEIPAGPGFFIFCLTYSILIKKNNMMEETRHTFITSRFRMLKEFIRSKNEKNLIGVWTPRFNHTMLICTVEDVRTDEDEGDVLVILKESEYAVRFNRIVLYLHEIQRIYRLDALPLSELRSSPG